MFCGMSRKGFGPTGGPGKLLSLRFCFWPGSSGSSSLKVGKQKFEFSRVGRFILVPYSAHSSGWFLIAWYRCFSTSFGKFSPSFSSLKFSINSEHVIFRPMFCPCRSVLSSMMAHVSVWTASCEFSVPGLQSRKRLEKCTRTRSRSCVSPDSANCFKNCRSDSSSVFFSNSKYLKYSSATARLNSLLDGWK